MCRNLGAEVPEDTWDTDLEDVPSAWGCLTSCSHENRGGAVALGQDTGTHVDKQACGRSSLCASIWFFQLWQTSDGLLGRNTKVPCRIKNEDEGFKEFERHGKLFR